jgi:anti-anti-sigma regulatory factor
MFVALCIADLTEAISMLRITTTVTEGSATVLKLEGKLFEPWIEELQRSIHVSPDRLTLDISSLAYADAAGLKALAALVRNGATLRGTSGFIAALLHVEQS